MDVMMNQLMTSLETLANAPGSLSALEGARVLRVAADFIEFAPDLPKEWVDTIGLLALRVEACLVPRRREDHAGQQ